MSKMGNEEDEEPLKAEVPREGTNPKNPKNPTSRKKQDHEDSGHAVYMSWCAALSGRSRCWWTTSNGTVG